MGLTVCPAAIVAAPVEVVWGNSSFGSLHHHLSICFSQKATARSGQPSALVPIPSPKP